MTAAFTDTGELRPGPSRRVRRDRPARPPLRRLAWVTFRQHRTVLLTVTAAMSLCALALFYYGRTMHTDFVTSDLVDCLPGGANRNCSTSLAEFQGDQNRVNQLMAAFLPLPLLFGLFVGAPLPAREYESGTYRFAFTQGVGRTRRLVPKIGILTAFTLATTIPFTGVVMWWYAPLVPLSGRLGNNGIQEIYGAVFVGRALFALALGIFAGALSRRVVPAIAATLVGWVALVVPSITAVRPRLMTPVTSVDSAATPGGWILGDVWRSPTGTVLTLQQANDLQFSAAEAGHKLDRVAYLAREGYTHTVVYQPADRFWSFQAIEAGGLAVLSVALLLGAVWLVRRRAA